MTDSKERSGRVSRVSGPIIRGTGLGNLGLYDVVEVGPKRLIGEIVRLEASDAIIQVYEENTGLMPGDPIYSSGRPLSVLLGPGLIGTIYDGIQRPLRSLYESSGAFLQPGVQGDKLDTAKLWPFTPNGELADKLASGEDVFITDGLLLGSVVETASLTCRILVPPSLGFTGEDRLAGENALGQSTEGEKLVFLAGAGEYRVFDEIARTSSGQSISMAQWWPVRKARPVKQKLIPDEPLITGLRVIDLFFPLSKGGTAAIPGGFGTGKTMTQHSIAKWCDADVIVYIGCGERGNEMTDVLREFPELIDPRTGRSLMERTILIANTSNMPVAAREVSIYTGVSLAEYYRDMGYHVAIMADSTSRWAEALRELSGRMEEMPAEEGFPAYLPTRLAEFYERAGRVQTCNGPLGSISIIGAVSPPGGDFSEPVTQHTKRFIRCFWALDRELANARHYPAVGWIESYSEYAEEVRSWWEKIDPQWAVTRQGALDLLKRDERLSEIVRLIGPDALPDDQRIVLVSAELVKNGFLQQNSFDEVDMYCVPKRQVRILELIMQFHERALDLIQLGAPLIKITSLPIVERLARLKNTVGNDELEKLELFEQELKAAFDEIQRFYRVKEQE